MWFRNELSSLAEVSLYRYFNKGCDLCMLNEAKYDCDPETARLRNKTILCPEIMFEIFSGTKKKITPLAIYKQLW